jgi:uncharacterized protein YdaL
MELACAILAFLVCIAACLIVLAVSCLKQEQDAHQRLKEGHKRTNDILAEMCRQVEELKSRLNDKDTDLRKHLDSHSKTCSELAWTSRHLADAEEKIRYLESQKPNLPKNYLSLIQAMQACTRFMSSNQWLLEQSKELTSAVAALADVADSIESKEELCPR